MISEYLKSSQFNICKHKFSVLKFKVFIFITIYLIFGGGVTLCNDHGLLLALCSGATPDGAWWTI